jgi:hypothetical protein
LQPTPPSSRRRRCSRRWRRRSRKGNVSERFVTFGCSGFDDGFDNVLVDNTRSNIGRATESQLSEEKEQIPHETGKNKSKSFQSAR